MISRMETQKIFIEMGDENIDIELILSVLRSSIRGIVKREKADSQDSKSLGIPSIQ
jgi:hypothetical protein